MDTYKARHVRRGGRAWRTFKSGRGFSADGVSIGEASVYS